MATFGFEPDDADLPSVAASIQKQIDFDAYWSGKNLIIECGCVTHRELRYFCNQLCQFVKRPIRFKLRTSDDYDGHVSLSTWYLVLKPNDWHWEEKGRIFLVKGQYEAEMQAFADKLKAGQVPPLIIKEVK